MSITNAKAGDGRSVSPLNHFRALTPEFSTNISNGTIKLNCLANVKGHFTFVLRKPLILGQVVIL